MPKHPDCRGTFESFSKDRREGEFCQFCYAKGVQCLGGEHPSQSEIAPSDSFKTPTDSNSKRKRNTAKQDSFKKKLLRRQTEDVFGNSTCEICGEGELEELEAAHLFDISKRAELEKAYSTDKSLPLSANDPMNGLLLCALCHKYFDGKSRKLKIQADGTIKVANSVAKAYVKYKRLHNTKVSWSKMIDEKNGRFPSSELICFVLNNKPSENKRLYDLQHESDESEESGEEGQLKKLRKSSPIGVKKPPAKRPIRAVKQPTKSPSSKKAK